MYRKAGLYATTKPLEKSRNVGWLGVQTVALNELVNLS
jgi:hypothetical protein